MLFENHSHSSGADPEILETGGALYWPPRLINEEIFWEKISISIFKFSPFLYTMKAYQWNLINFSKFANTLMRKLKKHSMRKEKLRKVGLFFVTGFFNGMINLFFLFCKLIRSLIFAFWCQDDARTVKRGSTERQNYNIYLKNNFNHLVINKTQTKFLYWQNVHIWRLIKVYKRVYDKRSL